MNRLKNLIPSMFHRRLLLLLAIFAAATTVLSAQLARLTLLEGPRLRREVEKVLSTRKLIPTERGRILDRKGRVLAEDRPCYDIAADYDALTGQWAYDQARQLARRDHMDRWGELSFDEREDLIEQYRPPFDNQLQRLWRLIVRHGQISREELERRKETIVRRVQAVRADVWDRRAKRRAQEKSGPIEMSEIAIPIAEEEQAHTLLPAVPDRIANRFRKLEDELPGLRVVPSRTRSYPYRSMNVTLPRRHLPSPIREEEPVEMEVDSLATHLVGSMRDVWAEDVQRRPFHRGGAEPDLGGYLPGDRTGFGGVEQAAEDRLRGLRGQLVRHRDTDRQDRHAPVPGQDVRLTVDIALQARVRAIMDPAFGLTSVQDWHGNDRTPNGTPLYGAAVVLEVDSGDILAMVSTPAPPPRIEGEPYPDLTDDPNRPLVNKPIGAVYPPGSTMKPLVYCMAVQAGVSGPHRAIDCEGHLLDHRDDILRCWIYREPRYLAHGPLPPAEAIARSCNIYFFTLGQELGARRLVERYRRWGFGRRIDLGLPGEVDGLMPSLDGDNPPGRKLTSSNAIMMGIGQGPVAVPPIQVAAAHATLARGGYYRSPILMRHRRSKQESRDLQLRPDVVRTALRGMYESANNADYGTGYRIRLGDGEYEPILNTEGVTVRSKTGTAQAPVRFEDRNDNGRLDDGEPIQRAGDHSWYIAHVAEADERRARYVIATIVEYGGSGGRVSGPVVNQIVHALKDEGYL